MNNVTSEIEQKFTDEQFLALAKAFAEACTEELLKSVEIVITGNKKYNHPDKPELNFTTLKAIAIVTAENFTSVNIKTEE